VRISSYAGEEKQEQEKTKSQTSPPPLKKTKPKKKKNCLRSPSLREPSQQFKEDRQREKKRLGNDLSPLFRFSFFFWKKVSEEKETAKPPF
jgi:hypothetical protein